MFINIHIYKYMSSNENPSVPTNFPRSPALVPMPKPPLSPSEIRDPKSGCSVLIVLMFFIVGILHLNSFSLKALGLYRVPYCFLRFKCQTLKITTSRRFF